MQDSTSKVSVRYDAGCILPSHDWFSVHIPIWEKYLADLLSKDILALEIGSYEGRSAVWLLHNTTPGSILYCVDTWDGKDPSLGVRTVDAERCFDHNINLACAGVIGRLEKAKKRSIEALSRFILSRMQFDLIYVDGSHEGLVALTDLCMSWEVLKVGGYLIFDDYRWTNDGSVNVTPAVAWDAFTTMYPSMDVIHQYRQCIVRKV